MKEPAPDQGAGRHQRGNASPETIADGRYGLTCPNADACRSVIPHPTLDTGATCRLCGQWIPRYALARMIAGVPA